VTFFVGVDGGGTSTRAVVVDADGRILGRAKGRGAVATSTAPAHAADAVRTVVEAVVREAGVDGRASVLWAGLAGAGQAHARDGVARALEAAVIAERVIVGTDVEAAFYDAFEEGPGVLLIAGTGSIAWARDDEGRTLRVGGWGAQLGDEGSGYAIGLAGLRAVMRSLDGREPATTLSVLLPDACGVTEAEALVGWIESAGKGEVASLAPRIAAAAAEGDQVARSIVNHAVTELVAHVRAASLTMGRPVLLWGGLAADDGPLAASLRRALEEAGYQVPERQLDPARGAGRLAIAAHR
jgi:N-acetylglucosamine kinase-like BadF-type ATPase